MSTAMLLNSLSCLVSVVLYFISETSSFTGISTYQGSSVNILARRFSTPIIWWVFQMQGMSTRKICVRRVSITCQVYQLKITLLESQFQ